MNLAEARALVSETHPLDKRGWRCCPFHKEDTASFQVFIATKGKHKGLPIFFCQGCKALGDMRDWLRKIRGVEQGSELPPIIKQTTEEILAAELEAERDRQWQELLNRMPELPEEARQFIELDRHASLQHLGDEIKRRLEE